MKARILVTGSSGLIGSVLCPFLADAGYQTQGLDLRATREDGGDVRDRAALAAAVRHCQGVVHLAAVSRVLTAEDNPSACWATNVGGLQNVLKVIRAQRRPPWLLFASSREVYGNQCSLPVSENAPLLPGNTYALSKLIGEVLVHRAIGQGLRAICVRFSNVYGRTADHADRVVPAFIRAALENKPLQVQGGRQSFDFTQVDDVSLGVVTLIDRLMRSADLPRALHFVGERATSLWQLAELARRCAGTQAPLVRYPATGVHASRFVGCGRQARALLGWRPQVSLEQGVLQLTEAYRRMRLEGCTASTR